MDELLKKALVVQRRLLATRKQCWLQRVQELLQESAFGVKVWKEWMESAPSDACECVTRVQREGQREVE